MHKTFYILLAFACSTLLAHAQVTEFDDFEQSSRSWQIVDGGASVLTTDNPDAAGLNRSCNVLRIERTGGNNWAGAISHLTQSTTANYVHILMYRANGNTNVPNLKVSDTPLNGVTDLVPTNTIVAGEWQDVVFYTRGYSVDFIFIMPDRTGNALVYVDDIVFSNSPTPRTTPNAECDRPEPGEGYTLVWNEDFTDGAFDATAWNIETTASPANNELQYYSARGVSVEADPVEGKQCLVLTARKENLGGRQCTSGRVTTQDKILFRYGMITARIWFPNTANGLWPAFWLMGNDISSVSWPACGETDIIELGHSNGFGGTQDRYFNGASHWGPRWDQHMYAANSVTYPYSVEDGFHEFTCIWDANHVAMYVDLNTHPNAQPYYQLTIPASGNSSDPGYYFHKQNFVLLNMAIGGDFPGISSVNNVTALANGPRKMYIDWVRIYQKGDAGELFAAAAPTDELEEGQSTALPETKEAMVCTKQLREGRMVLLRGNETFNLLGQRL